MKKLFESMGSLYYVEDLHGKPVSEAMATIPVRVGAIVSYELRPFPQHPLRVDLYGPNLMRFGFTRDRLVLDNGVVLTGRSLGGKSQPDDKHRINRVGFFDIQESALVLDPDNQPIPREDGELVCRVDRIVFGVVSSSPLGKMPLRNGFARDGHPFSFTADADQLKRWSTHALRLAFEDFEFTLAGTSNYWRSHVDRRSLQHDSVIGLRKLDGSVMEWKQVERVTTLLSGFLGWVNHCSSPVFHLKGYCQGKLVYKGYNLQPQPTKQRDRFSWLPSHLHGTEQGGLRPAECMEDLLVRYARKMEEKEIKENLFFLALHLLRSSEKGSPGSRATVLYLQDAFVACGILLNLFQGRHERNRSNMIKKCFTAIGVEDQLPIDAWKQRLIKENEDIWQNTSIKERGVARGPLGNIARWQFHLYDTANAKRLLNLPDDVQHYFVEVMTWLADLMILRVIGYDGVYFDRLSGDTKLVPWNRA